MLQICSDLRLNCKNFVYFPIFDTAPSKSSRKVERTGAPYSGLYASYIYVTHGWLELRHIRLAVFSSIYVIGQLYLSHTVHTTKNLASPLILPY